MALEEEEEEDEEIRKIREECREKPRHVPLRITLGDALLERGQTEKALAVYQEALRIKPSYGKAKRKVNETTLLLGKDHREEKSSVEINVPEDCDPYEAKERGNKHFNAGKFEEAWYEYCIAIDAIEKQGKMPDAKLHTNRAACLLTAHRWVPAAFDGRKSIEIDPEWWKGYWYFGQALLGQLKGKKRYGPAIKEKAQSALKALERASECQGFPEDKRERVSQLQARARHIVFHLAQNSTCAQQ
mmetsp:Transcript_11079/g.15258  ORF Transcript_11079/g.15258 Transcript_11079/m.15258 type:complete len:244 (+) Transcript_11079:1167-1898(+)|eukprot:CAMPEP_0197288466 /NCGR_PEP_ID=MMETSP0890-20130614/5554_1 /TAXON_ID=44058 ORGANISM="Aureoumbra lagunensis, Strain CCMP1510" /NCGR_SAMPLE_ID=MMETSP0890 /ASSEMBLY_ACC=CAM_ASM_000533 /LENGTH=243 /DNA_ID=CAMNT_0042759211 /DNA_START=1144 /DNA_END=1875 /DNA_ORIENTATION=+